jgi:hypothetical protein
MTLADVPWLRQCEYCDPLGNCYYTFTNSGIILELEPVGGW